MSARPEELPPFLLREDRDGIATLTLNRPAQMNLLTAGMLAALQEALQSIGNDPDVRVVVLAARGKGFCAGHDLKEIRALAEQPKIAALFAQCSAMMTAIERLPQPVIAKVQGTAAAAGCQLVAQCDLAVAVDTAKFVTSGVTWGFFCSTPGVAVGRNLLRKRAMEMLLTGAAIDAHTAADWGLVNRVVAADALAAETRALAERIAAASRVTVAIGKQAFYAQIDLDQPKAYAYAKEVMSMNALAADAQEGMTAFLEKRPASWTGR